MRTAKKDPLATRSVVALEEPEPPPWLKPVVEGFELELVWEPLVPLLAAAEPWDPEPPLFTPGMLSLAVEAAAVPVPVEVPEEDAPAVILVPVASKEDRTVGLLVISTVLLVPSAFV